MAFATRFLLLISIVLPACTPLPTVRESAFDEELMTRVERAAERAGARVYWVNPPYKRTTPAPE